MSISPSRNFLQEPPNFSQRRLFLEEYFPQHRDEASFSEEGFSLSNPLKRRKVELVPPPPYFVARATEYLQNSNGLELLRQDLGAGMIGAFLGEGHFVSAYLAHFEEGLQVVKVPHFKNTKRPQRPAGKDPMWVLAYEIKQYVQLKDLKFSINRHYNFEQFLDRNENWVRYRSIDRIDRALVAELKESFTDAFYRVEYIAREFFTRAELEAYNEQMAFLGDNHLKDQQEEWKKTRHPLHQLKEMFAFGMKHNIPLDLQRDNVRIREENGEQIVVLCDLYYEKEKFKYIVDKGLETFAKKDSALWNYLKP